MYYVEFILANTHLFWNPKYEKIKLNQAKLLCKKIEEFNILHIPVIISGDFNSMPNSDVYKFIEYFY